MSFHDWVSAIAPLVMFGLLIWVLMIEVKGYDAQRRGIEEYESWGK